MNVLVEFVEGDDVVFSLFLEPYLGVLGRSKVISYLPTLV